MTSTLFRLGTAELGGKDVILVERQGALFRLDALVPQGVPQTLRHAVGDGWDELLDAISAAVNGGDLPAALDPQEVRWLPPVTGGGKLVCIGSNYVDHIREMGIDADNRPPYPYSFMVPPSTTLSATSQEVRVPVEARRLDWEAEVALIIGRPACDVAVEDARHHVAGFAVLNDLTARDWSGPKAPPVGVDWVMAKAYDGFKPMGPFLTPARFVRDPERLSVRSWVNGAIKQDGTTADMWFNYWEIIAHLSRIMTLEPGDIIATGTPAGVGHGRKPPEYLAAGDHVAVEVELLGRVETTLVEAPVRV